MAVIPGVQYQGGASFSVDFVLGATMMLRSEVVQRVGGLDEEFVMYCEEIDWAWRIRKAGWQVQCVPAALVTHLGGRSSEQLPASSAFHLWSSRLKLYDRIHPRWETRLGTPAHPFRHPPSLASNANTHRYGSRLGLPLS